MAADWTAIKAEYISDPKSSYRKLAKKYEVTVGQIRALAEREKWQELRALTQHKTTQKTVQKCVKENVKQVSSIQQATDGLINYIQRCIEADAIDPEIACKFMRALKDAKDIKHDLTEYELREQDARIRALEKQSEKEQEDKTITVTMVGVPDDYAE